MSLDLSENLTAVSLGVSGTATSTVTGSGVDIRNYVGKLCVVQNVGTVAGTSPTLAGKIQDSADDSTFADVTGATFTTVTASTNIQQIEIDTRGVNRYIRYVGTIGGTSPDFDFAVAFVGKAQKET